MVHEVRMAWRVACRMCQEEKCAQATVEYAVVVVAILSIIVGCAAVWRAGASGVFAEIAQEAASHALGAAGAIDISLY